MNTFSVVVVASLLFAFPASAPAQGSDVDVSKDVAQRFVKTKGASLVGRHIHWHVPARALSDAKKARGGQLLFVSQGIGIIVAQYSSSLEEVRRRGGAACVRGQVVMVPPKERTPGDPEHVVVVTTLSHRKH